MNYQIECDICHALCWVGGEYEEDTGALVIDEDALADSDEACEHLQEGGGYTVADAEAVFDED